MLKKKIEYVDYDGNKRAEEFYFNLTKAELVEIEMSLDGGLEKTIKKIIGSKDNKSLINLFKQLILKSYGEKSEDGRRFVKNEVLSNEFEQTEAYSALFMELLSDDKAASAFVNGIMPKMSENVDTAKQIEEKKKEYENELGIVKAE